MVDIQFTSKVNVLVGIETEAIRDILIKYMTSHRVQVLLTDVETGLHFTKYKDILTSFISKNRKDYKVVFSTQSKEILEVLAALVKDKEPCVSVFNIYKDKSGTLKFVHLNQKEFIENMEAKTELRV